MSDACANYNCGHPRASHRSGGLCEDCISVGDSTGARSACQEFAAPAGLSLDGLPWSWDAPDGMAWYCPNCPSIATLGGNAAYHAKTLKHGQPELRPWKPEPELSPLQEAVATYRAALAPLLPLFRSFLTDWERANSPEAIAAFGGEPFPLPETITLTATFSTEALRALIEGQ